MSTWHTKDALGHGVVDGCCWPDLDWSSSSTSPVALESGEYRCSWIPLVQTLRATIEFHSGTASSVLHGSHCAVWGMEMAWELAVGVALTLAIRWCSCRNYMLWSQWLCVTGDNKNLHLENRRDKKLYYCYIVIWMSGHFQDTWTCSLTPALLFDPLVQPGTLLSTRACRLLPCNYHVWVHIAIATVFSLGLWNERDCALSTRHQLLLFIQSHSLAGIEYPDSKHS